MGLNDSKRYLQRLLDALTDEGLEELTLRLVKPNYPNAHRIRGNDGGIDVFSDHEEPPARGWQAKNYKSVPWDECRNSLRAAMENYQPPHYTFVFPFVVTKSQRDFWVKTFIPEQLKLYPNLKLDYMDDLAEQLEGRPDLVELLSDGAFGNYVRRTLEQTAASGVSPIARASDLGADPAKLAEHAIQVGKNDPNFSYGYAAREAKPADREISDRGLRFTMNHAIEDLPNFSVAFREGDRITEVQADARPEAAIDGAEPWFDTSPEGEKARIRARISLAKGEPVEFDEAVAVKPGAVPDRFRERLAADGLLRNGIVCLGLSKPVELRAVLTNDGQDRAVSIPLYRMPGEREGKVGWGGSYGGALLMLDFESVEEDGADVEVVIGLTLGVDGLPGQEAIRGLGFAQSFERAEQVRLTCPELLPVDGLEFAGEDGDSTNQDIRQNAATLAGALTMLEQRDGISRLMPKALSERDYFSAQLVIQVLSNGVVDIPVKEQFVLPLRPEAEDVESLEGYRDLEIELPPVAGATTGVLVRRHLLNIEIVKIVEGENGKRGLLLRPSNGDGQISMTLRD
jgi:hypothetical protein